MTYGTTSGCRSYRTMTEPSGTSALCNCGWTSATVRQAQDLHGDWLDHSGQPQLQQQQQRRRTA